MAASPEDVRLAENMLRNKSDYYKVLGVSRDASSDDIKRCYRRLCLKLHPDKNPHPKAAEAFKVLASANAVLSDEAKRRTYDRHGADGVQRQEQGQNPAGAQFRRGGGGGHPMDAEDLFSAFFGMPRRPQQGHYQQRRPQHGGNPNVHVQEFELNPAYLLPIFLFFIAMLFMTSRLVDPDERGGSAFGGGGVGGRRGGSIPSFSLHYDKKDGFTNRRTTNMREYPNLHVDYYVSQNFNNLYNRGLVDLRQLELKVLGKQKNYLERRCRAETLKQQNGIRGADISICDDYGRFRYVP